MAKTKRRVRGLGVAALVSAFSCSSPDPDASPPAAVLRPLPQVAQTTSPVPVTLSPPPEGPVMVDAPEDAEVEPRRKPRRRPRRRPRLPPHWYPPMPPMPHPQTSA